MSAVQCMLVVYLKWGMYMYHSVLTMAAFLKSTMVSTVPEGLSSTWISLYGIDGSGCSFLQYTVHVTVFLQNEYSGIDTFLSIWFSYYYVILEVKHFIVEVSSDLLAYWHPWPEHSVQCGSLEGPARQGTLIFIHSLIMQCSLTLQYEGNSERVSAAVKQPLV